jgi:hypothetical protein
LTCLLTGDPSRGILVDSGKSDTVTRLHSS